MIVILGVKIKIIHSSSVLEARILHFLHIHINIIYRKKNKSSPPCFCNSAEIISTPHVSRKEGWQNRSWYRSSSLLESATSFIYIHTLFTNTTTIGNFAYGLVWLGQFSSSGWKITIAALSCFPLHVLSQIAEEKVSIKLKTLGPCQRATKSTCTNIGNTHKNSDMMESTRVNSKPQSMP